MLVAGFGVRDLQGVLGEMELEQSEQERVVCSKQEESRKNEVGVKQAGNDDQLQLEINQRRKTRKKEIQADEEDYFCNG